METQEGMREIKKNIAIVLGVIAIVWLFTPVPTLLASSLWNHYHASSLALALDRTDAPLAFIIGTDAFGGSTYDLSLAMRAFQKATAIDSGLLWSHYQLARVLFVEGKLNNAEMEIDSELAHNPENLRALYIRGLIRAYDKNLAGAESDFKRFTEWAPTEWAGYNDLAWVLGQEGKYAEAKTALEKGFKNAVSAATNPWLWNNLGVQELNLEEYKDAINSFEKAKTLAANMSEKTWTSSYPGNDPSGSAGGIEAFQKTIQTNLENAYFKPLK